MCAICCWWACWAFGAVELFYCFPWVVFYSSCTIAQLLQINQGWEVPESNEGAYSSGMFCLLLIASFKYGKAFVHIANVSAILCPRLRLTVSLQMKGVCQFLFYQMILQLHLSWRYALSIIFFSLPLWVCHQTCSMCYTLLPANNHKAWWDQIEELLLIPALLGLILVFLFPWYNYSLNGMKDK